MKKNQQKIVAVAMTLLISTAPVILLVQFFTVYSWSILCFIPFLIGFLPPYWGGGKNPTTKRECYTLSFSTLALFLLILLLVAPEEIIRITMVLPFVIPFVWLFSYIAFRMNDRRVFKVKDFFRLLPIFATAIPFV